MTKFKNYLPKSIVFVFLSLFFVQFVSAQVTSVNYHLKYDNLRGYTDCYLVINQDSATTELERVQGNVQYSLVVPTGTEIKIGEIYMPLLNNADYEGVYPVEWTLGNVVIAPAAQSASDFYSVSVDLDPSSYYNNLYQGDEIKLFRVYIDSLCSNEIRLYQNGIDPPSDAEGMEGIDFSQSFSLGTFGELYDTIVTAQGYLPEIYGDTTICDGDVIYLSTDIIEGCTYIWEGNDTLTYPNQAKIKVHSSSFNGNSPITLRVMKDSLCMSPSSSHYVTVNDIPDVSFDGSNEICVGSTTNLLPNTGGYWTVDNPIVATVNIDGIVTGISPGVTYPTFIDTFGCSATTAIPIEVVYTPTVVVDDYMLNIGETTQAHPIYGCTWTSSNLAVLSISNSGVITAVGQGVATVSCTVNETGCVVTSNPITVNDCPSVCLTGPSNICVGQTTTLSPSTGGTWASSNTNIATVTNSGIITGIGSGTVTFIFTFAGGCSSTACIVVTVYPEPIINPASQHICVGSTTNLTASSSGTWSSTNSSIATVNSNTGTVTGVSIGTTQILFTDSTTGCTATSTIYVGASSNFVINGPTQICIGGTTQAVSTENGTWTSSNTSVAIINSSGTITGVGVGTACINFIPNCGCGCTEPICISVVSAPAACLTGPDHICVDGITTLSPTSGGTWTSSSPSVATVTNSGVVTGVSPGTVTFTFASNGGCNSTTCVAVTVYSQPILSASQPSICIAHTTNLTSSTNGTWTSLDTHATITSAGVVTGVSEGIAHFLFTDSVTGCTETISINILSTPIIQVNGPTEICVGGTSNVSSNTNGVWTSSNPAVATVTNYGVITGISEGTSCISFISSGSCGCAQPICITVMPGTDVEIEDNSICIAETTNLTPSTGGTWVSSNPTIATVSNSGIVTGLSAGVTSFTFTNSSTGCTGSVSVEVLTSPVIEANGPTELCVGGTTSVSSNTDGIWASSNPAVATIDINTGLITAVSEGITCISFTGLSSSCACAQPVCITVMPGVSTYITGDNNICISGTTTISPAIGGTWVSNNPAVATISNSGVVTAIGEGTATFTYSANETGCTATSEIVTVWAHPIIEVDGTDKLCIGESTNVSANTDGVWSSSVPSVATVDNNGVVTAVSEGVTCISFTSSATSCPCAQPICITVSPSPVVEITGEDNICIEGTTTLSPTTGGTWISNNINVAIVHPNSGVVTGISQGNTTFTFTNTNTGCTATTEAIIVSPSVSVSIEDEEICIASNTNLIPSTGTWVSSDETIATVSNEGLVTGVSAGTAIFTYTDGTSCTSTVSVIILAQPIIEGNGSTELCIGETTNVSANTEGVWTSSIPSVATVDNNGVVTAVSEGVTCISFTSSATSCPCSQPICITVSPSPVVEITGEDNICIEGTTTLSPTTGGTWISYDNGVATINNSGVVTGISQGITCFVYTDIETGCVSDEVCVTVGSCTPCDTTDVPLVLGTAYIDENENGVFDTGETVLSNVTIQITPDGMMVLTNEQGEYQIAADYGEYTLTAIINEGDWVTNELTSSINITDICNEGNDFGFVPNPAEPELVLSFSHSMLRCDYETQFFIDFKNVGTEHFTGQLEFYYDPLTDFIDAGPNPISNSNNKLVFDIVDLRPFKRKTYIVVVRNPPASDPLPFMTFKAEIKTTSGEVVASYEKTKQLRCAFDPNDKSTYPDRQGEDNLTLFSEEVDYMIRFQNTGNDIAYNIKVEDKLDANMDPTTIRVLSSSHPVETMIESGKIVFFFDDINLVDSTVNYRESQGYVKFRVRQLGFRAENTEVFNDANIIFDNNPPITTNEVKNTLVGKLCSNSLIYVNKAICPGSEYLGYTEEGHYIDTLQSTYGCDSIRSLQLVFADVPQISIDTTICPIDDIYGYNTTGTYEFTIPSEEGCDTLVNLNLEVLDDNNPKCLVADNNVEKEVVKVYPNPTNNMIYISGVSNNVKMRMTSMTGETIYINPEFENDKVSIRTVGLPSGVYYLTIFSEYEVVVKKITKL